jgi:hypothetical protein
MPTWGTTSRRPVGAIPGANQRLDLDGMLGHRRDRLVGVLVLELSGGVRFPYID